MKVTKKYSKAFILGIQGALEYRISFLLDIASSALPIVMQYFLWRTIFDSQGTDLVFGYSYHEIVIYIIFANLISKFISSGYFKYEIADDIKNGGLNKYITKPIGYGGYRLCCFLGEKCRKQKRCPFNGMTRLIFTFQRSRMFARFAVLRESPSAKRSIL